MAESLRDLMRCVLAPGVGPVLLDRLVGAFGTPAGVLGASQAALGRCRGIGRVKAGAIHKGLRESEALADEELAGEWIPKWQAADHAQIATAGQALLGRDDVSDRLGEIACPTLIIHGTDDQAITMERAEATCAGLGDCRGVVKVDGAAHAPNMTHPDVVNPALREFLDAVTA